MKNILLSLMFVFLFTGCFNNNVGGKIKFPFGKIKLP